MVLNQADRNELMGELRVHARDLRVIDPALSHAAASAVLSRERCLLVSLQQARTCTIPPCSVSRPFAQGNGLLRLSSQRAARLHVVLGHAMVCTSMGIRGAAQRVMRTCQTGQGGAHYPQQLS